MDGAEPIILSVDMAISPARTFEAFVAGFASWWPAATHSLGREIGTTCRLQSETGGSLGERTNDGPWLPWGTVDMFEPGRHLRFTWHPGREPESAQWVEVSFVPSGTGTRATLTHGGWEALGEIAPILRREYASGWQYVFGECYTAYACGSGASAG